MSRYYERNDSGYTRGGLDVVTGVNLFFKGILIFPILVLATFIGLTMVKFVLFQGLPTMSQPTEEQRQRINERDQEISRSIVVEDDTPEVSLDVKPFEPSDVNNGYPVPPVLPAPSYQSQRSDEMWNTEIYTDPFEKL